MRRLTSLVIFCAITMLVDAASAAPMYRWRDAAGTLHFSNRTEAIPDGAREIALPPLPQRSARSAAASAATARTTSVPLSPRRRDTYACEPADPSGVAAAVADRLGRRQLDGLTLIVAGVPVAYDSDAVVAVKGPDADARTTAAAEQAAIAYPGGTRCPTRPPLERYTVSSGRRPSTRRLCDDYQRAFAEVGVAVSRDQGVAHSFRELAERFVGVAERGYTAGGRTALIVPSGAYAPLVYASEERVGLDPWLVEAHIAQTHELGAESAELVDELTVALEEIDAAARRAGCW